MPPPDFTYQPLAHSSHLRLIEFDTSTNNGGEDLQKLSLQHYNPTSAPPHLALSYVWGEFEPALYAVVNGARFRLTANLFQAMEDIRTALSTLEIWLSHISARPVAAVYLWIDAICLNQFDEGEKSIQVGRMKEIYSSAATTLIWLGPRHYNRHTVSDHILELLAAPEPNSPSLQSTSKGWEPRHFSGRPNNDREENIHRDWLHILKRDWFTRVWVVQEYALSAHEPTTLLGSTVFLLDALLHIKVKASYYDSYALAAAFGERGGYKYHFKSDSFRSLSVAEQLLRILMDIHGKRTSLPHDSIYGVLGLVKASHLPRHLLPDYSKPIAQLYMEYIRFIFTETGNLELLQLPWEETTDFNAQDLSTWTENLTHMFHGFTSVWDRSTTKLQQ